MSYLSAYFWRKGEGGVGATSLVLQQMRYEKERCSVLFGCLCSDDAVMAELLAWFEKKRRISRVEVMRKIKKWKGVDILGIVCMDEKFFMFYRGEMACYVINTRFGKNHARGVEFTEEYGILQGEIQNGVGILLADKAFASIGESQLQDTLIVEELQVTAQLERRLMELGKLQHEMQMQQMKEQEDKQINRSGGAAIFIVVR